MTQDLPKPDAEEQAEMDARFDAMIRRLEAVAARLENATKQVRGEDGQA